MEISFIRTYSIPPRPMFIKTTSSKLVMILIMMAFGFVAKSQSLNGGTINNPSQSILYNAVPAQLHPTIASGGTECAGVYNYFWEQSADNVNFSQISGASDQYYQPPALTVSTYFRRGVNCGHLYAYTSNTAYIQVAQPPFNGGCMNSGASQTVNDTIVPGPIDAGPASGGGCSSYTYQWQSSEDNIYFTNIPNASTQLLYFTIPLTKTRFFRRKAVCLTGTQYTDVATITVNPVPKGTLSGSINLIGHSTAPNGLWRINIRVDFYKAGWTNPMLSRIIRTDSSGHFLVDSIPVGTYKVYIKSMNKLSQVRLATITTGVASVNFGTMRSGDVNNDNRVDDTDIYIMRGVYNVMLGDKRYDPRADLNGDGIIGLGDFSSMLGAYNQSGEMP